VAGGGPIGIVVAQDGRQEEALRVAVGVSALDDPLRVFLFAPGPAGDDAPRRMLEMLGELGHELLTDRPGVEGFTALGAAELARKLLDCRHVVTF